MLLPSTRDPQTCCCRACDRYAFDLHFAHARLKPHFLNLLLLVSHTGGGHHVAADAGHSAIRFAPACPTICLRRHCCDARSITNDGCASPSPAGRRDLTMALAHHHLFPPEKAQKRNSLKNNPWGAIWSPNILVATLPACLVYCSLPDCPPTPPPTLTAEEWQLAAESSPLTRSPALSGHLPPAVID